MSNYIGKPERASQDRVIKLFQTELGYTYLGDWEEEVRTQAIEENILKVLVWQRLFYYTSTKSH